MTSRTDDDPTCPKPSVESSTERNGQRKNIPRLQHALFEPVLKEIDREEFAFGTPASEEAHFDSHWIDFDHSEVSIVDWHNLPRSGPRKSEFHTNKLSNCLTIAIKSIFAKLRRFIFFFQPSSFVHLTMADKDNATKKAPPKDLPRHPQDEVCKLDPTMAFKLKNHPHAPSNRGMGVNLAQKEPVPVCTDKQGNSFPFNERANKAGLHAASIIVADMAHRKDEAIKALEKKAAEDAAEAEDDETVDPTAPQKKKQIIRIGERKSSDTLFRDWLKALVKDGNCAVEGMNKRRLNLCWNVMAGFNSDDANFNPALDRIQGVSHKVRLGIIPSKTDELTAAMKAVIACCLETTSDNKTKGNGPWTLPIVHILNGHFKARGHPQITFHHKEDADKLLEPVRQSHNTSIWFDKNGKRTEACVEGRQTVRRHVIAFLEQVAGLKDVQKMIPKDLGPLDEEDLEASKQPAAKKRRVVNVD